MKEKVDFAVLRDANIDRETIAKWLKRDIESVYILVSEIMQEGPVHEALIEVFWQRYLKLHAENQIQDAIKQQK